MKLKDLHFNPIYNSITEDVIADFYRPALASSRVYKRASAYFDSNILSLYSSGIESIVEKKGHIYFIFSDDIPEKDFEDMKKGYENRKDIEQSLIDRVTTTAPTPGLCNLAYLISIGLVDIKIAFSSTGIFHAKTLRRDSGVDADTLHEFSLGFGGPLFLSRHRSLRLLVHRLCYGWGRFPWRDLSSELTVWTGSIQRRQLNA